jgi:hypothetical protein
VIIIGIDPGMSGGIAKLRDTGGSIGTRWIPSAISMPATEKGIADHLWKLYQESVEEDIEIICFLEQVQVMPAIRRVKGPGGTVREEVNAGIVSTAKFMQGYGFLRGCLLTIGITVEDIRPQAWQKLLGCMTRGDKNVSKRKAQQLFPQSRVTHKTADALCIAEAGRIIRMGLSAGTLFEPKPTEAVAPWERKAG